jgi:hypothetical protein
MLALTFFCLPEVYAPVLLKRKAISLRNSTGDQRWWHPQESERIRPSNILNKYFGRPLRMLTTEPMVTCIAFYASYVYGILYLTLAVFPIVFREQRGYSLLISTLPFLGLFVGVLCAVGINLANQVFYVKAVAKNKGRAVPEARLSPMLVGGVLFTTGLFWVSTVESTIDMYLLLTCCSLAGQQLPNIIGRCQSLRQVSLTAWSHSGSMANDPRLHRSGLQHYFPAMSQLLGGFLRMYFLQSS